MGNPLVMRAGYEATLLYEKGEFYSHINELGRRLREGLQRAVDASKANAHVTGYGSMSKLHLLKKPVRKPNLKSLVTNADHERDMSYFRHLVQR
ncbi:MAG: hypothetical protein ABSA92_13840 [Candidatus Bathyarchaeia archaeon]